MLVNVSAGVGKTTEEAVSEVSAWLGADYRTRLIGSLQIGKRGQALDHSPVSKMTLLQNVVAVALNLTSQGTSLPLFDNHTA